MNQTKLALSNVKKSFKDYTIYFLTLTFAVCIFYAFNSIGSQSAMMEINSSKKESIQAISQVISYISVFVSFILGGLIIYANNFLIKRRKKELGLYMSLGMGKGKISKLLVCEELIIGIFSLIAGLIVGVIASQGLSVITAKLFSIGLSNYKFVFSSEAMIKTIIYFGIIFVLVMIFNTFTISRYKLIDLLNAHKKNQEIKIKNPIISGIIFIVSLVSLGVAYYLVKKVGLDFRTMEFKLSIVLGIIGTGLFFYGLTSFLIIVIQKNKNLYLKKLNIFTLRQMNSKINTNFISMTVICLMLFLTISMLSVGVSFKKNNVDSLAPYDASVSVYADKNSKLNLEQILEKRNFKIQNGDNYEYVTTYNTNDPISDILDKYTNSNLANNLSNTPVSVMTLSDFNKLRKLSGQSAMKLNDNEVLVQSSLDILKSAVEGLIKSNNKIKLDGKEYVIANKEIITKTNSTNVASQVIFNLIVPDNFVKGLNANEYILDINYGKDNKEASEKYYSDFATSYMKNPNVDDGYLMMGTRILIQESMDSMTTMILYIALYIGVIFLISSAAILALQQLSEASDSAERYNSLRRIGAPNSMINKSIFIQTLAYFMLPLVLAIVHSVVGISVANDFISVFGKSSIVEAALLTMGGIIIIYGAYFIATYIGYKNIVKKS
ncbi:FtsX-like permease family protein [Clostridium sardiniense]|uniref:FtsX-like permease family protein n=1 Tax=Clostridium sardiniense TaxID=29369 RepID=UPI00195E9E8C|nr:ABC transporter permease [Clostridium sardiniense]MBM7833784.1 putative ABC transport system permease protein [Clostridium sardiniense]